MAAACVHGTPTSHRLNPHGQRCPWCERGITLKEPPTFTPTERAVRLYELSTRGKCLHGLTPPGQAPAGAGCVFCRRGN